MRFATPTHTVPQPLQETETITDGIEQRLLADIRRFVDATRQRRSRSALQRDMEQIFRRMCGLLAAREGELRKAADPALIWHQAAHDRLRNQIGDDIRSLVASEGFPLGQVAHVFDAIVIHIAVVGAQALAPKPASEQGGGLHASALRHAGRRLAATPVTQQAMHRAVPQDVFSQQVLAT